MTQTQKRIIDDQDMAYFVMALHMAAEQFNSDVLNALYNEAKAIRRHIARQRTTLLTAADRLEYALDPAHMNGADMLKEIVSVIAELRKAAE